MMMNAMKTLSVGVAVALVTSTASAGNLFNDDFNSYANGNLAGQGGWDAHSGAGNLPPQVNGGQVFIEHGSGSREDVNHSLGDTMEAGDIWMFAFDVIVNGTDPASTTYFAHFRDDGTGFNSRVFVTAPNTGPSGDFTFGIGETSSSTPAATFATTLSTV